MRSRNTVTRRELPKALVAWLPLTAPIAAQRARNLWLISACSNTKGWHKFPAILYRFDEGSGNVVPVRTIVPASSGTQYITYSSALRLWVAAQPSVSADRISAVLFDAPENEFTKEARYDRSLLPLEMVLFAKPEGNWIGLYLSSSDIKRQSLLEIPVGPGEITTGDWSDYRYLRTEGVVGGIQPMADNAVELFSFPDGTMTFRKGNQAIESGLVMSRNLRYSEEDLVFAHVLTPRLAVLESKWNSRENEGPIGSRVLRIGVRRSKEWVWHDWKVPGDMSRTRCWGPYVGAIICAERFTIRRQHPSPGWKDRRQEPTSTGYPFDLHWSKAYFPGTLLLYDAETRKQYAIETGQGDSEILLVEGDTIYYRANDRLYRGRIGTKDIEEVELLLKRQEVVDVHWMFRSKS